MDGVFELVENYGLKAGFVVYLIACMRVAYGMFKFSSEENDRDE